MDDSRARDFLREFWAERVLPALKEYIEIPNVSPAYDRDWQTRGAMDRAVDLVIRWIDAQHIAGLRLDVIRLPGRTPLIFANVPGTDAGSVLLYGHLDKQPPMDGWKDGLGPWTPVIRDGRLYGRGAADDGYAAFASIAALATLQDQAIPHPPCTLVIEASEESGSPDLPHYIAALHERIGTPELVICLDSGCGDYERLWVTTSLRGLIGGTLRVSTLTEGVHSGSASGIVPSSFRIVRHLLDRLEDGETGSIRPAELFVDIPADRRRQATAAAAVLGDRVAADYPFVSGTRALTDDPEELLLNRTWRPQLEITGAAGLPALDLAGNVLRPSTAVKLSMRLPPTADARSAAKLLKRLLEDAPPYDAQVEFDGEAGANGWNAPALAPWLAESLRHASLDFFGKEVCYMGEGGTIPFMAMLGQRFPAAQFLITGVLGPGSNAHGPNEFLHLPTAANLTACVARVLADHLRAASGSQTGETT